MKKLIVGIFFMAFGGFSNMYMLKLACDVIPLVDTWNGTKMWHSIWSASGLLNLSVPFTISIILFLLGFFICIVEYCSKPIKKL